MSQVRDTALHTGFRQLNGIPDRMRWLTKWDTRARKELAPGLWPGKKTKLHDYCILKHQTTDCIVFVFRSNRIIRHVEPSTFGYD